MTSALSRALATLLVSLVPPIITAAGNFVVQRLTKWAKPV